MINNCDRSHENLWINHICYDTMMSDSFGLQIFLSAAADWAKI